MTWKVLTTGLHERLVRAFDEILIQLRAHDDRWARKPAPDRWSALEVAEHVALANQYLLVLVGKIRERSAARAGRGERPRAQPSRLDHLEKIASSEFAWKAPDHMRPSGRMDAPEIEGRLRDDLATCLAHLSAMPAGEGSLHSVRMSVIGETERLDLYQFLQVIALHTERHARQMRRALDA